MKKLLAITASVLLLAGCSSSGGEGKTAECSYYWDAANVVLAQWYQWHLSYPPIGLDQKRAVEDQLNDDWALRVLEAPSGCFPESDIEKANKFVN